MRTLLPSGRQGARANLMLGPPWRHQRGRLGIAPDVCDLRDTPRPAVELLSTGFAPLRSRNAWRRRVWSRRSTMAGPSFESRDMRTRERVSHGARPRGLHLDGRTPALKVARGLAPAGVTGARGLCGRIGDPESAHASAERLATAIGPGGHFSVANVHWRGRWPW